MQKLEWKKWKSSSREINNYLFKYYLHKEQIWFSFLVDVYFRLEITFQPNFWNMIL